MKRFTLCAAPLALLMLAGTLQAQDRADDQRGPRNPEMRQRMLERFDKDNDGELSRDERQAMREAREERTRDQQAEGDRPGRGPRADGERRGRRGDSAAGQARGNRRGGPREDAARGPRRGGPPEDAARGPRRGGPPEGMDRGPRRGGPPEDAARGPRRGGPGGPPSPEVIFERMDENGDGQLSKAEFTKLAERFRTRMAGQRPAGPPRAAEGEDGRGRPPRGEFGRGQGRGRGQGMGRPRPEPQDD